MEVRGIDLNWAKLGRQMMAMQKEPFMEAMLARRESTGSDSPMGKIDCALLYALTRWAKPGSIVETGGFLGMASSFMLKALADEGIKGAKLFSIEWMTGIDQGSLIPAELKAPFVPMTGKVEDFMDGGGIPDQIDMFLHDSSHRYKHMRKEFRYFFKRLKPGGLLVSHDVNMNAAFTDFVSKTYQHDKFGQTDDARTMHSYWGRFGNLGFLVKSGNP